MELGELIKQFSIAAVMLWIAFKILKWVFIFLWAIIQINWYMFTYHPIWSLICFGFFFTSGHPILSYLAGQAALLLAWGYKMDKPGMLKAMGFGAILGLFLAKRNSDNLRIKD